MFKPYLQHDVFYVQNSGGIGNGWRNRKGQFANAPAGWRKKNRYEEETTRTFTKNGQSYDYKITRLTKAGEDRYQRDINANRMKKAKDRVKDETDLIDPYRWKKENKESAKDIATGVQDIAKGVSGTIDLFNKPTRGPRYDLSSMTDAELRAVLNREQMERQYNDYFNPPTVNKGAEMCKTAFNVVAATAGVASTALGIALAVQKLRGKSGD